MEPAPEPAAQPPAPATATAAAGEGWSMLSRARALLQEGKPSLALQVVLGHMRAPIYVYYKLENFYHNHRRYVKSRSDKQLRFLTEYTAESCSSVQCNDNGFPIVPCGLNAWSLFNDTYGSTHRSKEINVNRKNISQKSKREHKFGKNVFPSNFQNRSFIGGGKLYPVVPLSEQEDLIVWMPTAALPKFWKIYGVNEEDLQVDETTILISNNYNSYFRWKEKHSSFDSNLARWQE